MGGGRALPCEHLPFSQHCCSTSVLHRTHPSSRYSPSVEIPSGVGTRHWGTRMISQDPCHAIVVWFPWLQRFPAGALLGGGCWDVLVLLEVGPHRK